MSKFLEGVERHTPVKDIDDIDEDTISELAAIDREFGEGATVADVIRDYGSEIVKKYIDYMTHPARHEDGESSTDRIRVDTERHNHRGGVTARGVETFATMEELNEALPQMKKIYHVIKVNGKELGEEDAAAVEDNEIDIDSAVANLAATANSGPKGLVGKVFRTSAQKAKEALKEREKANKLAIPVFRQATAEIEQALKKAAQ